MDACANYLETSDNRLAMYSFLARMYRTEVDADLLHALRSIDFAVEGGDDEYASGLAHLQEYLAHPSFATRQDLAVDYAKVFLAAGISQGGAAFPYESVYTSEDGLVMQDARDDVVALYREKGLAVEGVVEPEDHIAFEFEFMGELIREGRQAALEKDEGALAASLEEQRSFMQRHLLNWVPEFCGDVKLYADTAFYGAIASVTAGFLSMDSSQIDESLAETEAAA